MGFEEVLVALASDDIVGDPGEGTDEVEDDDDEEDGDKKFWVNVE